MCGPDRSVFSDRSSLQVWIRSSVTPPDKEKYQTMNSTRTTNECPIDASPKHDPPEREKQDRKAADRAAVVARLATLPGVVIASAIIR